MIKKIFRLGVAAPLMVFCTTAFAEVLYTGKTLRDPFVDLSAENTTTTEETQRIEIAIRRLRLEGILYRMDNPQAIINGKIYGIGALAEGVAMITQIEKDEVVLKANDKEFILKYTKRMANDEKTIPAYN